MHLVRAAGLYVVPAFLLAALGTETEGEGWIDLFLLAYYVGVFAVAPLLGALVRRRWLRASEGRGLPGVVVRAVAALIAYLPVPSMAFFLPSAAGIGLLVAGLVLHVLADREIAMFVDGSSGRQR